MRQTHPAVNRTPLALRGSIPWLSTNSPVLPGNSAGALSGRVMVALCNGRESGRRFAAYDSGPCPTLRERARVPDTVETTRQDTTCAVFVDASSGLWHQAAWGVWQGASRSPNGTDPASRGVWNALRIYLDTS